MEDGRTLKTPEPYGELSPYNDRLANGMPLSRERRIDAHSTSTSEPLVGCSGLLDRVASLSGMKSLLLEEHLVGRGSA
jgi:hypothetical protein